MIDKVTKDLKTAIPTDLVDYLMSAYSEIKENYLLERHEPSELNGGKFVEACYRIIEQATKGSYTAVGAHMPDMIGKLRAFEQLPATSAIESYRIHIPRALCMIYNIRNKRGVGHLGGDVNPNFTDSSMICACADWILAELLRIHNSCFVLPGSPSKILCISQETPACSAAFLGGGIMPPTKRIYKTPLRQYKR